MEGSGHSVMVNVRIRNGKRLSIFRTSLYPIRGRARIANNAERLKTIADPTYQARVEQAIILRVDGWDRNCPEHSPRLLSAHDVERIIGKGQRRIEYVEAALRSAGRPIAPA